MAGEIISEHRARSNRNPGRHHRGFAGDFPRNPHQQAQRPRNRRGRRLLPASAVNHRGGGGAGEGLRGCRLTRRISPPPTGRTQVDTMRVSAPFSRTLDRRLLQSVGILGGMAATFPAWVDTYIDLDLPGGPDRRELTTAFPQKAQRIVQRTRPPLLETPAEVFDRSIFTPNDQILGRRHWAGIPEQVEVAAFKVAVRG